MLASMIIAFRRLLLIAIGTLVCIVFALVVLRQLGQGQKYADSDHPLMKDSSWLIFDHTTPVKPASSNPNQLLDANREKVIIKIPLRLSNDGIWMVANEEAIKMDGGEIKPIIALTAQELAGKSIYPIETWLKISEDKETSRFRAYYFYILDSSATRLDYLSDLETKYPTLKNRVLFSSPYMRVNIEMRKIRPLWLYGASTTDVSKLRFFNSLFIESLASMNADFVEFTSVPHPRLIEELNIRKRRVLYFVKPDFDLAKIPPSLGGWVISDASLIAKYVALTASKH